MVPASTGLRGAIFPDCGSNLLQPRFEPLPRFVARFLVLCIRVGRFPGSHETVTGSVVSDWLVGLAGFFHQLSRFGNGRVDARVVAAIKTIDRRVNAGDVFFLVRTGAVEDEGGFDVFVVGGKAERLAASPTKAPDRKFAVASRQLRDVIGHG